MKLWKMIKYKLTSSNLIKDSEMVVAYLKLRIPFSQIQLDLHLNQSTLIDYTQAIFKDKLEVLNSLQNYLTLEQILDINVNYQMFHKNIRNSLIKKLWYPTLLLIVLYGILALFVFKLFPNLSKLLVDFEIQNYRLQILYYLLLLIFIGFTVLFIALFITLLILLNPQNQKILILLLKKNRLLDIFKKVYTQMFAYLYRLYLSYGASTQQIFDLMVLAPFSRIIRWLSILTIYQLDVGMNLSQAFNQELFDPAFLRFINLAILSNNMTSYLEAYLELNERIIYKKISQFASVLQTIVFSLIGLLLIILYQMLFAPMQLLNQL